MDQRLEILMNRVWISPWADRIMAFVSDFGAWKLWLLILVVAAAFFCSFRLRAALLAALLAVGLSDGIAVNLLKHAVSRPRPSQVEPGVRVVTLGEAPRGWPRLAGLLREASVDFPHGTVVPEDCDATLAAGDTTRGRSFPSGHAANNMAVATVLILFFGWRGAFYLPFALLICWSRIYTGSHWPLDVVAGMILGILGGIMAVRSAEILWSRYAPWFFPGIAARHVTLMS